MMVIEKRCAIIFDGQVHRVKFGGSDESPASVVQIEAICDIDEFGDLVGIEILDFKHYTGLSDLLFAKEKDYDTFCKINYAEDSDALYIKFKQSRPKDQRVATVQIECTRCGEILGLQVAG